MNVGSINSTSPSDAYMRQQTGPSLAQILALSPMWTNAGLYFIEKKIGNKFPCNLNKNKIDLIQENELKKTSVKLH